MSRPSRKLKHLLADKARLSQSSSQILLDDDALPPASLSLPLSPGNAALPSPTRAVYTGSYEGADGTPSSSSRRRGQVRPHPATQPSHTATQPPSHPALAHAEIQRLPYFASRGSSAGRASRRRL